MVAIAAAGSSRMSNGAASALNSEQDLASIPVAQRGPCPPGYRAPQKRRRAGARDDAGAVVVGLAAIARPLVEALCLAGMAR
jgi:hypothetical protein